MDSRYNKRLGVKTRSDAITNKIKTEYSTYLVKKADYESATEDDKVAMQSYRLSDNSVVGAQETIESDVKLPETRIKSIPENGSESSSGNLESEWNIDEQDPLIASAMCSEWQTASQAGYEEYKTCKLGTSRDIYYMVKKYNQEPKAYEVYDGLQVNEMNISMALDSFVKMSFGLLGSNNPAPSLTDPTSDGGKLENATYGDAMTTKSFITRELNMNIKDYTAGSTPVWSFTTAEKMRQCPSFELAVTNNKESTKALGEKEAIEMSDGDFEPTGTFEVWNADEKAINLKADAINGKDKLIEVEVFRDVSGYRYGYMVRLIAHLQAPSESKDGNKLKYSIPYSVNTDGGLEFIKYKKEL